MNDEMIKKIRAFNRYYTTWLDVMNKNYLKTELSWHEARVLYEIYIYQEISATELCEHLNMDKSYVSRMIGKFEKQKLLEREFVAGRKGVKKIWLTDQGKEQALQIDKNGNQQIADKFQDMDEKTCQKLCESIDFIEKILREYDKKGGQKNE